MDIVSFFKFNVTRTILKSFYAVPLKNTIFLSAYEGKQYSCNPRVIYEHMLVDDRFSKYRFIWEKNDLTGIPQNPRLKLVKHNSLKYFWAILTSKVIITNTGISARIPVRKSQISINTWHGGGGFKKSGLQMGEKRDISYDFIRKQAKYFLSSSELFTRQISEALDLDITTIRNTGMPRNDIFFHENEYEETRKTVRRELGITDEIFVLYAPTYRGELGNDSIEKLDLDFEKLKIAIEEKFHRPSFIGTRIHYFNRRDLHDDSCINLNHYSDMQKLLVAADILVTDYSSSIWDFALSGKLCILFVPDLDTYINNRGLCTSIYEWPGLVCHNNEEVESQIKNYDDNKYKAKLDKYFIDSVTYDDGNATKRVLEML